MRGAWLICYHPNYLSEDTGTESLSNLPKVTQLAKCRQNLNPGSLGPESMSLTMTAS